MYDPGLTPAILFLPVPFGVAYLVCDGWMDVCVCVLRLITSRWLLVILEGESSVRIAMRLGHCVAE